MHGNDSNELRDSESGNSSNESIPKERYWKDDGKRKNFVESSSVETSSSTPTFGGEGNGALVNETIFVREKEKVVEKIVEDKKDDEDQSPEGEDDNEDSENDRDNISGTSKSNNNTILSESQLEEVQREAALMVAKQLKVMQIAEQKRKEEADKRAQEEKEREEREALRKAQKAKRQEEELLKAAAQQAEEAKKKALTETIQATLAQMSGKLSDEQQKFLNEGLSNMLEGSSGDQISDERNKNQSSKGMDIDKVRFDKIIIYTKSLLQIKCLNIFHFIYFFTGGRGSKHRRHET